MPAGELQNDPLDSVAFDCECRFIAGDVSGGSESRSQRWLGLQDTAYLGATDERRVGRSRDRALDQARQVLLVRREVGVARAAARDDEEDAKIARRMGARADAPARAVEATRARMTPTSDQ